MLAFCQGCVCKEFSTVMPGLVPGIHVLLLRKREGVDGRDKPGHDAEGVAGIHTLR
jgi:hypothetical protein